MKVFEALSQAARLLEHKATPNPRQDAELLLSYTLGSDRSHLLTHHQDELSDLLLSSFFSRVLERSQGKPIQYIIGRQEFRGLEFEVTPDVLIPRPETELVVEEALRLVQTQRATLVDVGTGSGCIAISLAVELPHAKIFAIDLSQSALGIAKKNATKHDVNHIRFLKGDVLAPLRYFGLEETVDCIVSNPPYVSEKDFPKLQRDVRDWEPKLALVAPNNGLSFYSRLIPQALSFLRPEGYLVMEIGYSMQEEVCGLFDSEWRIERIRLDLNGIPRIVVAQKIQSSPEPRPLGSGF